MRKTRAKRPEDPAAVCAAPVDEDRAQEEDAEEDAFGSGQAHGQGSQGEPKARRGHRVGLRLGGSGRGPECQGGEEREEWGAIARGQVIEPRPEGEKDRGDEGQGSGRPVQVAPAEVDEGHRRAVSAKAQTLSGGFERQADGVQPCHQQHEEEVGGPVDRRLADVPDDAVARREVLGVAEQHGRVFFGTAAEVDAEPRVKAQRAEEQRDDEGVGAGDRRWTCGRQSAGKASNSGGPAPIGVGFDLPGRRGLRHQDGTGTPSGQARVRVGQ